MSPARQPAKARKTVVLSDPADIKALTHPTRLAVLDEFFAGRELTATEAALITGVTPSAMSYHLRALEKVGIIERADPGEDGRQRPWRAAARQLEVHGDAGMGAASATAVLARQSLEQMGKELTAWIAALDRDDPPWQEVAGLSGARLWLTIEELRELSETVERMTERWRERSGVDHPDGARPVRVGYLAVPLDPPE